MTPCPCGCGRRLPLLEHQLSALALADIVDLPEVALQHGLPLWAARHVRETMGRGEPAAPAGDRREARAAECEHESAARTASQVR